MEGRVLLRRRLDIARLVDVVSAEGEATCSFFLDAPTVWADADQRRFAAFIRDAAAYEDCGIALIRLSPGLAWPEPAHVLEGRL
jgi:head-tail adaptor